MTLSRVFYLRCAALAAFGLFTSTADAATRSWDAGGGADTAFTTDANWSSNIEPGAADTAEFDRGAAFDYSVTFPVLLPFPGNITTDRLDVGSNTVTFEPDHSNTDYILDNTTTIEADPILGLPVRGITIGAEANDTAAVLVSHLGLLQAVAATLGHATGSNGTLTLNQNNDLLNITGGSTTDAELIVGRLGTGVLDVSAGADVTVNGLVSGFPAGGVTLGRSSSGQGTANISGAGSTLDLNTVLIVGDAGTGTLNVTAGGFVEDTSGIIGNLAGSTGTANISGSGSNWSNVALFVGEFGSGGLNITGGGVVDSQAARIAGQSGSMSTATLNGAGSAWNIGSGTFQVGLRGHGTLSIADAAHVNSDDSIIGDFAGSQGIVTVSGAGSTWTSTNTLFVGNSGNGLLSITGGGQVTGSAPMFGTAGYIAREIGSTGEVTVDGAGSTWTNNGALIVGSRGDATLDVTAGGQVTSGTSYIGDYDTSTGEVNINGSGSNWSSTGVVTVGWDGAGTLNIMAGGDLESNGGAIGEQTGSTGQVTVDGAGSLWTVTGNLSVGSMGQGTLTVQNGGFVDVDGNVYINTSSTANLQAAAVGGDFSNGGQLNLHIDCMDPIPDPPQDPFPPMEPPVDIGGDLTNDGTFFALFDCMDPAPEPLKAIAVGRSITNNGEFTVTNVDEQDVTIQLGAGETFTNNASGVVDLNGPDDVDGDDTIAAKYVLGANVLNSGQMNVRTNAQVTGSLATAVNAETLVEPATPCCGMVLDVTGPVTNGGTFTMRSPVAAGGGTGAESGSGSSSHQDVVLVAGGGLTNSGAFTMQVDSAESVNVKLQLGAGETFTNSATGVVNLNGPTEVADGETIQSKHVIGGSVVNSGQMNVRGNTQIEGSLTVAVNAETVVEPATPCCGMVVEVAGPISNSGTFTMMTDSASPQLAVELAAGETFTNNATGVLQGNGTIDGDVLNHGQVQPGHSAGLLTIAGDYTQASDGRLVVDVAGTTAGSGYDQLAIGGNIALDGVVEVIFGEGFAPQVGNRFEIITTAGPMNSSKFAGASLPGLPAGMDWGIHYDSNVVALAISVPGDYSGNGTVDADDYTVWRDTLGQTGVFLAADGDGDNDVDADDYAFWKAHFGETFGGGSADFGELSRVGASPSQAVPEPMSMLLAFFSALGLSFARALRRRK